MFRPHVDSIACPPIRQIRNILLLDDDVDLVETLELSLMARDFVITSVHNGLEGLEKVMAFDFDVIICDLMMPAMSGDRFYASLQRTKPHLCDRFIFITGHAGEHSVDAFLASTKGIVLHKPLSTQALVEKIDQVLDRTSS